MEAGLHEYDGRLPDWSPEGLERETRRLRDARRRCRLFAPADLDEARRFERDHLLTVIDSDLFWIDRAERPFRNPMFYTPALDPGVYVVREYAPLEERLRAYIAYAEAIPEAAAQIRANLRTPLPRTFLEFGRTSFGGLARFYERDVPVAFASIGEGDLQRRLSAANRRAIRAMRELDAWLGEEADRAGSDFALGEEKLSEMLWATERLDEPLDRLAEIAREDLKKNEEALRRACRARSPGEEVGTCVERVRRLPPAGGSTETVRRHLETLRSHTVSGGLATIPAEGAVVVAESPGYLRWNPAYIDIPGPYEDGLPAMFYLSPPDPDWSEAERRDYVPSRSDLVYMAAHEVWPGHYLHFLHSHRSPSRVGRLFVSYGFAEGWAHYAEALCREAASDAENLEMEIALRLNALLRDVRCVAALGLHRGRMSVAEAERLFRDRAFQDPANARQQAVRGTFDPSYLLYTLGKLMVEKLRDDWTARHGGRESPRAFHDRLLSFGAPPLPLVRRAMLGPDGGSPL